MPLFTQVQKWVPVNLILGVGPRWTSAPFKGEWNYFKSFHATYRNRDKRLPAAAPGPLSAACRRNLATPECNIDYLSRMMNKNY